MREQPRLQILSTVIVVIAFQPPTRAALSPAELDEFTGQEAPAFSVRTAKGDAIALKQLNGHPVLVNFFANGLAVK